MLITEEYRELNRALHETNPHYGTEGRSWAMHILDLSRSLNTKDILDYGCGKSTLQMNLPFKIKQYDPAIPKFSDTPEPADIVVCTDVLEHIEPELIGEVLDHIKSLTVKALFCTISCEPANKNLPDGRNAHLIVEKARWWINALWDRFEVIGMMNGKHGLLLTAEPKRD